MTRGSSGLWCLTSLASRTAKAGWTNSGSPLPHRSPHAWGTGHRMVEEAEGSSSHIRELSLLQKFTARRRPSRPPGMHQAPANPRRIFTKNARAHAQQTPPLGPNMDRHSLERARDQHDITLLQAANMASYPSDHSASARVAALTRPRPT